MLDGLGEPTDGFCELVHRWPNFFSAGLDHSRMDEIGTKVRMIVHELRAKRGSPQGAPRPSAVAIDCGEAAVIRQPF
jgi:hypothetical protein